MRINKESGLWPLSVFLIYHLLLTDILFLHVPQVPELETDVLILTLLQELQNIDTPLSV